MRLFISFIFLKVSFGVQILLRLRKLCFFFPSGSSHLAISSRNECTWTVRNDNKAFIYFLLIGFPLSIQHTDGNHTDWNPLAYYRMELNGIIDPDFVEMCIITSVNSGKKVEIKVIGLKKKKKRRSWKAASVGLSRCGDVCLWPLAPADACQGPFTSASFLPETQRGSYADAHAGEMESRGAANVGVLFQTFWNVAISPSFLFSCRIAAFTSWFLSNWKLIGWLSKT